MYKKPRKPTERILSKHVIKRTFSLGIFMGVGTFLLFSWALQSGYCHSIEHATTLIFTTYVVYQMFNVLNYRSESESVFKTGFFKNRFLLCAITISLLLQICVVYLPVFQVGFHTVPLTIFDWLIVIGVGSTVFIFEETRKALRLKY
jgi:Ca2+-transporting ATPase